MTRVTEEWINPTDVLYEERITKDSRLHRHVSVFCAALMQMHHYNFKVEFAGNLIENKAKITGLPKNSRFDHVIIYEDGYVQYNNTLGNIQFEGRLSKVILKNMTFLKKDILGI